MKLSEAGESRVRGYLYVFDRALRTFLPPEFASDAVREIDTHIRERVARVDALPDERAALERVLLELGPPLRVAQAYSAELVLDEAVTTGRIGPTLQSIWYTAVNSVVGFFGALGLFLGYSFGAAFVAIAALKPIFPGNVGFIWAGGRLLGFGANFPLPAGQSVAGGYWVVPLALAVGLLVLVGTHRSAKRFLTWFRDSRAARRPEARNRG